MASTEHSPVPDDEVVEIAVSGVVYRTVKRFLESHGLELHEFPTAGDQMRSFIVTPSEALLRGSG